MANPATFSPRPILHAFYLLFILMLPLIPSLLAQQPSPPQTLPPSFAFRWLGDKSTFHAGDTATITIHALNPLPDTTIRPSSLYFSLTVNGKKGNSTLVTDVAAHLAVDPASSWNITFVPLKAGDFVALVAEERFGSGDSSSSLQFTVAAAGVHPAASPVSWMFEDWHEAGAKAYVAVVPRDAFGNAVPRGTDVPVDGYFGVSGSYVNGSAVEFLDFHFNGWTDNGCLSFDFGQTLAGEFLVHVLGNNTELRGSPLLLTVKPGFCNGSNSFANGTGLAHSVAGSTSWFAVFLEDKYGSPSPVETAVLQVQILSKNGTASAQPTVSPIRDPDGALNTSLSSVVISDPRAKRNEDFYGNDVIMLYATNRNGDKSGFLLELSLEVFEGTLTMTLPAGVIPTVELKTEDDNCWQPLENYVAIANHFDLTASGIRFLGTVQDCNNAMQNLFYNVPHLLSSHINSVVLFLNP
ncbi:hypothetical protein PR202_ga15792 [Eleusine coracana subsp. coracana]|uniref:GEX2 N-terminal Ig-like domain-containing protein n=1 Tax=Eleusine coracana subsp. coracana TaxID=191504 RepID=A0AAV5CL25_ELECO|nr:hypothetical protein PR202_ga15792 [Eleusine coracana subsp. coracana]